MVIIDSYMVMILPDDITKRISEFIAGKLSFPFVGPNEMMCMMYLYGRSSKVSEQEVEEVSSLAQHTASKLGREIDMYTNGSTNRFETEFIRSKFINRELQLTVERKSQNARKRIASDPAIASDCFALHVAYYKQDHFLALYGPFRQSQLTFDIRSVLTERMVMMCYNRKGAEDTGLTHPLIPAYLWFKDQAGAKP
jgi:hypothetical protein